MSKCSFFINNFNERYSNRYKYPIAIILFFYPCPKCCRRLQASMITEFWTVHNRISIKVNLNMELTSKFNDYEISWLQLIGEWIICFLSQNILLIMNGRAD